MVIFRQVVSEHHYSRYFSLHVCPRHITVPIQDYLFINTYRFVWIWSFPCPFYSKILEYLGGSIYTRQQLSLLEYHHVRTTQPLMVSLIEPLP